jgi:polysaccharide export outer membrane protein
VIAPLLLTAVLGLTGAAGRGQTTQNGSTQVPAIPDVLRPDLAEPGAPGSYSMGPGDLLSVFVLQMPDLTRQVRIGSNGTIRMPLLSPPVHVAGLTAEEAGVALERALSAAGLAVAPRVDVTVREVTSRPITVMGEVAHPTVVQAFRPMSLLEVLSRAGGTTINAGDQVLVSWPGSAGMTTQTYSLSGLLKGASSTTNPELTGGEQVRVLRMKSVYVVGAVSHPGAFGVQPGETMSVLRAVALGEGIKSPADTKGGEIIRTGAAGQRMEIPVDIDAMLHHKLADVELQPGDILYVPESGKSKILSAILADAGSAAVIAVGYRVH